ncbi:MAG: prepilin-type N-terminal cleavage/methylation domain-containing protein [Nitrospirae bacterium]|nr:prepilin-type N-terminal cleavage/methylation domain-containing protein [Nitrospirota bacterium]
MANVFSSKGLNRIIDTPISDGKGFTLVEALVSMVILTVVMLGMLQTIIYVNAVNMKNYLRDEAVRIGQEDIDKQRIIIRSGNTITSTPAPITSGLLRHFRNMDVQFYLCRYVTPRGSSTSVSVSIIWQLKGEVNGTTTDSCFNGMTYTGSYNIETAISPLG